MLFPSYFLNQRAIFFLADFCDIKPVAFVTAFFLEDIGLTRVTAQYSQRKDGGIRVVNRGYLASEGKWKEAEGKAYFVHGPEQGFFKVSFFGPFYGSYVILELDHQEYSYALVCGPDKSYLWILARSPELDKNIINRLISRASALGFDTVKLIFVKHDERDKT